jgi:hypothetical protein
MRTLSNVSISFHLVKRIDAKFRKSDGSAWLDLTIVDRNGIESEVTLFAADTASAQDLEGICIYIQDQNAVANPLPRIINTEMSS